MKRAPELPVASERAEQTAFFQWLKVAAPPGLWASCIPAGDGKQTRAPGFFKGTPDAIIVWKGRAIFLEFKRTARGRVAIAQHDCHAALCAAGALVFVAAGWEAAADFLCTIVPMRDERDAQARRA
jgi:hypothetical protein